MENEKRNIELIFKYLNNELSDTETVFFNKKLKTENSFAELYNNYTQIWKLTENKIDNEVFEIDIEKEWINFRKNINSRNQTKIVNIETKNTWKYILSIAATIVIFIGLFFVFSNSHKSFETEFAIATVKLPDKSEILVNRNSKIEYSKKFKNNRIVKLSGDAYFKVEPDTENAFIVEAGDYRIEVVGTEFYVNSDSENFEVVVEKGKIKVYKENNKQKFILLTAGEKTIIKNKTIDKTDVKDKNFLAWKTKKIVISDLKLIEISRIIEKTYGIEISFSDASLQNLEMTATFENQSLESVLKVIEATLNIKIIKQGKKQFKIMQSDN